MDNVLTVFPLILWGMFHPSSVLATIAPRAVPTSVVAVWNVQQQPTEHPWEQRLRQVESTQLKQEAIAKLMIDELNKINSNRDERLKLLEQWKRDSDRARLDQPAQVPEKPGIDPDKIDAIADALKNKPIDWELIGTVAGGVAATIIAQYLRHRSIAGQISKKLDDAIAVEPPRPNGVASEPTTSKRISLAD